MHKKYVKIGLLIILVIIGFNSCNNHIEHVTVASPNSKIVVQVTLSDGQLFYSITHKGEHVINHSKLGLKFKDMPGLGDDFIITEISQNSINKTWEQVWGEKRLVENRYEELIISLIEPNDLKRQMDVVFRVFDDGVGFRYHIPKQENIDSSFIIIDEITQFSISDNKTAWWIPAYKESFYESLYRNTTLEQITDTVCSPLTIELHEGLYIAIHEANLNDYAAMNLYHVGSNTLEVDLTPWSTGEKVFAAEGMYSPWRTITIGEEPGDLITSYIALNLNEPNKIEDTSWIKPGKYLGIWWSMHIGKHTWGQGDKHGATTENAKEYLDFASEHEFDGVLIEGWNTGWDSNWVGHGEHFSFTQTYPDFDIEKVTTYAAKKGVKLIGHHETGGAADYYEQNMEEGFDLYNKLGVNAVKTGYVTPTKLNGKEFHSSQYGVLHFRKVIEMAAKYQIMIDNHEPVMPTGLQRTYPNLMTQEGVRGQEYNAWSKDGGNPPEHTTIVPFTRGLAGPMDFTFGTFNFENPNTPGTRVRSTIAKQLALYVVIYSPLQMASDLPENYTGKKEFQFIKDVPVDWDVTLVPEAAIGDYVVTVRKDRNSEDWYLGAVSDENERTIKINLGFLSPDESYLAEIYSDGPEANWETNPYDCVITEKKVYSTDILELKLAASGGQAIRFIAQ